MSLTAPVAQFQSSRDDDFQKVEKQTSAAAGIQRGNDGRAAAGKRRGHATQAGYFALRSNAATQGKSRS
jgi:hypothetical protein